MIDFFVSMLDYVLLAVLGALGAIMANRGIAVFNDGLRPVMPEFIEGRMSRQELAATAFAMSFGLVIGFGIPVSIAASIILIHSIFLGTDIIGTSSPSGKIGLVVAGVIGAAYGVGILIGLQFIVDLFAKLPVNFMGDLGLVSAPVVAAFAAFPALATGMQYGYKKGLLTLLVSLVARQVAVWVSPITLGSASITLNAEGSALIVGMIFFLFFAMSEKSSGDSVDLAALFSERMKRIRKHAPYLMVIGGLVAATTSYGLLAGDPISLNLMADGQLTDAGLAALARAIGFVPLIASTAIATGVYGPVGMTFVFAVGLLIGNPLLAGIVGAVVIGAEVFLLDRAAALLDKFPGLRNAGENIRNAMTRLLEVALLVGGMNAANAIVPGLGFLVVVGLYIINDIAGRPVVRMAVGPIAAILVGVLANILALIGLI